MFSKLNLLARLAAILAGGGLLVWGAGFFVSQVRGAHRDGVTVGRIEMALEQREAAEEARAAASAALSARDEETARRIADAETRAGAAETARNRALKFMRKSNVTFDECLALPYPDSVRAHHPLASGLLDGG